VPPSMAVGTGSIEESERSGWIAAACAGMTEGSTSYPEILALVIATIESPVGSTYLRMAIARIASEVR